MSQQTPAGHVDRRRHPRIAVDWPCSISLEDGSHEARLRDVSQAGVCFFLDRRVPEMTILQMSLDLPPLPGKGNEAGPRLEGSGVVVRCQPLSQHVDHYEVAVFLNDLSESNRERLEAYVVAAAG